MELCVRTRTKQAKKRQLWQAAQNPMLMVMAKGMARTPTAMSAAASDTTKKLVTFCRLLFSHTAQHTSTLPKTASTAMASSTTMYTEEPMVGMAADRESRQGRGPGQLTVHSCSAAGPAQAPEPLPHRSQERPCCGRGRSLRASPRLPWSVQKADPLQGLRRHLGSARHQFPGDLSKEKPHEELDRCRAGTAEEGAREWPAASGSVYFLGELRVFQR